MKVPTSTAWRARTARVSRVMKMPCSGEICMRANPPVASTVSAIRSAWISSTDELCAIR